jgi:CubicO group peptidase (beta-lactamase class C family)
MPAISNALNRACCPPPVLVEGEPSWTLSERMAHYCVPGLSVAVTENFALAWEKGYGVADGALGTPVTENTLLQAASISKPVSAAALMRLVDQGRLSLDAEVN